MGRGDTTVNAVIGAVVTVVLSFTGISPILGGGVAGYLQGEDRRDGAVVGAIAGGLAIIPFFMLLVLAYVFLLTGAAAFGIPGGLELLVIVFVLVPLLLVWNVGLGALGGYLGAYLRADRASAATDGG